jgi:hypothetical protein
MQKWDSTLGSDEPQSSLATDHVSDFGGSFAAADELTPLEQELPVPLPSQGLTLEVASKMIADAASKRDDLHSKELAEKESLLIDQARRLSELKEQLEAQSYAAAAPSKAVSESADVQPYSASEEELHEVFAQAKKAKHGITDEGEFKSVFWELLSPMPNFSNGKHSGPPSLTSRSIWHLMLIPIPTSLIKRRLLPFWDRKRVMVILRKTNMWISCETMIAPKATPQRSLEDSTDKSDHRSSERWGVAKGVQKAVDQLFKHCIKDPWISFCNPSELLWRKVVLNLSTSHILPLRI